MTMSPTSHSSKSLGAALESGKLHWEEEGAQGRP